MVEKQFPITNETGLDTVSNKVTKLVHEAINIKQKQHYPTMFNLYYI